MDPGCLDERAVVGFLSGGLSEVERSAIQAHLASCSNCTDVMVWAAADQAHASRAPGLEGRAFSGALAPGARVDRYQILAAVGRGGMGEVYAAYHPDLDRRIAIKVVHDASDGDSTERRARLLREARAIARLSHPNVVAVYDAGTVDERVFIAMELVDGETVDAWLRSRPRTWREILDVFAAAGRGLAAAHAAGVVHRDFKPQNVMIGRDGTVRVMDFGLARLAEEPAEPPGETPEAERPPVAPTVTKAGFVVGTLAYMAPEQFRREPLDARADQFSFCVALHEALYGHRPKLAHLNNDPSPAPAAERDGAAARRSGAPPWARAIVQRGLSEDRERRFPSMDALLAALERGRTRLRRRAVMLGGGVALVLLSVAGWRVAATRRLTCVAPNDRLAAVWPTRDESSPRRQSIHRAFAATGRANAETAWQRVAGALDDYTAKWSAMHVQTCEATHARHEQPGQVLDLRMACLTESLERVRALTEVLSRADGEMVSQSAGAISTLTPLAGCADVAALRAAVPPPHDEKTARAVESLRRSLREAVVLEEVGNDRAALTAARGILPAAEATGYQPLLAETLYLLGAAEANATPDTAEGVLERAFYTAEASRDDVTAAKAAICLVAITGYAQHRRRDSDRWGGLAHAILDRLGPSQPLLRAWLLHNEAGVVMRHREFEPGRAKLEESLALKQAELGKNHPDVARSLAALAWAQTELGHLEEALRAADRAADILTELDPDSVQLAYALNNRGDTQNLLQRYAAAEASYRGALRILRTQVGATNYTAAYPLHGIGEGKLAQGDAAGAVRYFDEALKLREGPDPDRVAVADTQFALARALLASGGDRARALTLAAAAQKTYASNAQPKKQHDVVTWLAAHTGR